MWLDAIPFQFFHKAHICFVIFESCGDCERNLRRALGGAAQRQRCGLAGGAAAAGPAAASGAGGRRLRLARGGPAVWEVICHILVLLVLSITPKLIGPCLIWGWLPLSNFLTPPAQAADITGLLSYLRPFGIVPLPPSPLRFCPPFFVEIHSPFPP